MLVMLHTLNDCLRDPGEVPSRCLRHTENSLTIAHCLPVWPVNCGENGKLRVCPRVSTGKESLAIG